MIETTIQLTIEIPYRGKTYLQQEGFIPYSINLIKELLEDSKLKRVVEYLETNTKDRNEENETKVVNTDSIFDYYFDLFSVLKIVDIREGGSKPDSLSAYFKRMDDIQLSIVFEKIKLSLIPYCDILTEHTVVDEKIEQYFEYLYRKIYDFSDEKNPLAGFLFEDENFNSLVKNIEVIFDKTVYDGFSKMSVRGLIQKEFEAYIQSEDFTLRNKADYAKNILLLSTNGLKPRFLDRYRMAICGAERGELDNIVRQVGEASSSRINKLLIKQSEHYSRSEIETSQNYGYHTELLSKITQKVNPNFIKKNRKKCFGLLLSDNLEYYSLSGIKIDNLNVTAPALVANVEKILREKYKNIQRKCFSDHQITFYEVYTPNGEKGPSFDNLTPINPSKSLEQFKREHNISNIFTHSNKSFYYCFSCCEPKLLAEIPDEFTELTLYVKKEPCANCKLIIPEYKAKLKEVIFYNEKSNTIETFPIAK